MTLGEFKEAVLEFIEEHDEKAVALTRDIDIADKINAVVNNVMFEVMRYKKIEDKKELAVTENEEISMEEINERCYQIRKISNIKYRQEGKYIIFREEGTAKIYYYKYPVVIDADTDDDDYEFEIDLDALEVMKIGVAANLLKTDVSNQYGKIWENEYARLLQTLDSRKNAGTITIGKRS